MCTYRAYFRRLLAFEDGAAVPALPESSLFVALEGSSFLEMVQDLVVALLMSLLNISDQEEFLCQFIEPTVSSRIFMSHLASL